MANNKYLFQILMTCTVYCYNSFLNFCLNEPQIPNEEELLTKQGIALFCLSIAIYLIPIILSNNLDTLSVCTEIDVTDLYIAEPKKSIITCNNLRLHEQSYINEASSTVISEEFLIAEIKN